MNVDQDTYEITQYGKGTTSDIIFLAFESTAAFFPSMIRLTLSVLFVNTQLITVVLVQVIKEIFIFINVYYKLLNKKKAGKFTPIKNLVETPLLSVVTEANYKSRKLKM